MLQVLRDGEQIRISVKMAPRPVKDDIALGGSERITRAETYWHDKFVPLMDERYVGDPNALPMENAN